MTSISTTALPVAVRVLQGREAALFGELGSRSSLDSLRDPDRRAELLACGLVLGAFWGAQLVGCACLEFDVPRAYVGMDLTMRRAPVPNVYFCSTFVRADCRGVGVGTRLYSERLRVSSAYGRPYLMVEILGTGEPLVVDPGAVVGYDFHAAIGFRAVGHSIEHDRGPLLIKDVAGTHAVAAVAHRPVVK